MFRVFNVFRVSFCMFLTLGFFLGLGSRFSGFLWGYKDYVVYRA